MGYDRNTRRVARRQGFLVVCYVVLAVTSLVAAFVLDLTRRGNSVWFLGVVCFLAICASVTAKGEAVTFRHCLLLARAVFRRR
jgi:hypothetical protein